MNTRGPMARVTLPSVPPDVREALERVERARGALYTAHQLIGGADGALDQVERALRDSGCGDLADELRQELVGLDVLEGRWTYQVVEEFDDGY